MPVAWDSSILLKVDETRVDIIKALIIGPEGTPYVLISSISRGLTDALAVIRMDGMSTRRFYCSNYIDWIFSSFLFDIFLGPSYNQSPPSVKYMTVSRGLVNGSSTVSDKYSRRMEGNSGSIPISTRYELPFASVAENV